MDRDRDNLWTRRTKTSVPTSNSDQGEHRPESAPRAYSNTKRFAGPDSRANPFNAISPLSTTGITSPSVGASSAFGLGTGAFGFGSATKTPKTPGTAFDFAKGAPSNSTPPTPLDKRDSKPVRTLSSSTKNTTASSNDGSTSSKKTSSSDTTTPWPLKHSWVIWYRPPTPKNNDYEKSMKPLCRISTAQQFWRVFTHLKRPSALPSVSDYHFFKDGIRPMWEDSENKRGGKWIIRLKKGVADRYWEELLLCMIGDQFAEAGDEVCGAVLSVRSGEDVFSIWTKVDGGRNIKIRETIKRVLGLPTETNIVWKSHDDSIAQRSALDQARQDRHNPHNSAEKRRGTTSAIDEGTPTKERSTVL